MPADAAADTIAINGKTYLRAALRLIQRCPARDEFIELVLDTEEGRWKWCIPGPAHRSDACSASVTLALTLGRYAVQAHKVTGVEGKGLGFAMPSATAAPLIIAGARVYLERALIAGNH